MTNAPGFHDEDEPQDLPPSLRGVKIAVSVMTGFLFFSAAALLLIIFMRLTGGGEPEAAFTEEPADAPPLYDAPTNAPWWEGSRFVSKLNVPDDAEVVQMTIAGDRLALLLERPDGREIILFDLIELRELGVIRLTADDIVSEDALQRMLEAEPGPEAFD